MVRELGRGRPILVVHGGMGNEVPWLRVAKAMSTRYRVVLIRRRLYRLEIPVRLEQAIADQVAEVLDVARGFDEPCVIVGHSSGALIALEALAADSGPFAGGIIYEPPTPCLSFLLVSQVSGHGLALPSTLGMSAARCRFTSVRASEHPTGGAPLRRRWHCCPWFDSSYLVRSTITSRWSGSVSA